MGNTIIELLGVFVLFIGSALFTGAVDEHTERVSGIIASTGIILFFTGMILDFSKIGK